MGPWILPMLAAAAKSLQSCLTLCDPIDGSPPGSPIPGILQARTLEWVAISFSNAWKWKVKVKSLSHVWLLATPWTIAHQAPPSMGFSRQEYWSGLPFSSPGDLPNQGIEPGSPPWQADSLPSVLPGKPRSHFRDEEIETQSCKETGSKSHSHLVAEPGLEPQVLTISKNAFPTTSHSFFLPFIHLANVYWCF